MQANYTTGLALPKNFDLCERIGEIDNKAECMRYLVESANLGKEDLMSIVNQLNERAEDDSRIIYFSVDGVQVEEDDTAAHYRLFDTGYLSSANTRIYFSFHRYSNYWRGAYVLTLSDFKVMADRHYNEQIARSEAKAYMSERKETPFEQRARKKVSKKTPVSAETLAIEDINKRWQGVVNYIRVMCTSPTWVFNSTDNLLTYLYALEIRICGVLKRVNDGLPLPTEYMRLSSDKSYVYVNTGISNKLSKPIYIVCELQESLLSFKSVSVIRCRDMLVDLGFTNEDANSKPKKISFFKEKEVPIFMGDILDVDIENPKSVNHCMMDNINRLPEYIQEMSEEERIEIYFKKLQVSFERQAVDSFYFKPFYCLQNDMIEYIIPCYVNDDANSDVEFGFVLGKSSRGFWGVYTVLTAEQCKDRVQVLQPFQKF